MFDWLWRPFNNLLLKFGITNLQCSACGQKLSELSDTCPYCGASVRERRHDQHSRTDWKHDDDSADDDAEPEDDSDDTSDGADTGSDGGDASNGGDSGSGGDSGGNGGGGD
jgi:hypothetical protein